MKFHNPYRTESQLCDVFVEYVKRFGWTVYPEHGGFDLLLVKDGVQVGVEAKLRCNLEVVSQALEGLRYAGAGPHFRGVLVPQVSVPLRMVCHHLRLHTWGHKDMVPEYGMAPREMLLHAPWEFEADARVTLPEVALQGSAGKPSPRSMSIWRVKALKVCILLEQKGYLTRNDIQEGGCSPARWTQDWMKRAGEEPGPNGRPVTKYVAKNTTSMPSVGYEAEMELLKERVKE